MRPCPACGGHKRVQIRVTQPGTTMYFDCPVCRKPAEYRVLKAAVTELRRKLWRSRVTSVILLIAAVISVLGVTR